MGVHPATTGRVLGGYLVTSYLAARHRTVRTTWAFLAIGLALCLGGCVDMGELDKFREDAAALRDDLSAREADWLQRLESMSPGDPLRTSVEAELAAAKAKTAVADAALKRIDQVLDRAKNPGGYDDPLGRTVGLVLPWLPEPMRTPAALGAALVATLWRSRQLKQAAVSIARGVNKAMQEDEQFRTAFKRHAGTFRTIQTPAARRIVDEATNERFMVRLPV